MWRVSHRSRTSLLSSEDKSPSLPTLRGALSTLNYELFSWAGHGKSLCPWNALSSCLFLQGYREVSYLLLGCPPCPSTPSHHVCARTLRNYIPSSRCSFLSPPDHELPLALYQDTCFSCRFNVRAAPFLENPGFPFISASPAPSTGCPCTGDNLCLPDSLFISLLQPCPSSSSL